MKNFLFIIIFLAFIPSVYAFQGTTYEYTLIESGEEDSFIPCIDVKTTEWEGDGVFDNFVEVGEPVIDTFCSTKLSFSFTEDEDMKGIITIKSNPHEVTAAEVSFRDDGSYKIKEKIKAKKAFKEYLNY